MTSTVVPLRRIAALSVAIPLVAAPIASAQSPEAVPANAARPNTAMLSPAAFVRLAQPPKKVAPVHVMAHSPRLNLHRPAMAATARLTHGAAPAPQQRGWAARHKVVTGILIGVGAFFGLVGLGLAGVFG